ncbi:MAG: primosomal protein N' [Tenacibaculum sp.]
MPFSVPKTFTYSVTEAEARFLKQGMRVAVSFGKKRICTSLVFDIHKKQPSLYKAKEIHQILDEKPIVNQQQLKLWEWIAKYYMCNLGDVYRTAIPSAFILESETSICKNIFFTDNKNISDESCIVFEALEQKKYLSIDEITNILGKKNVLPIIDELLEKNAIYLKDEIYQTYKPKRVKYVNLNAIYNSETGLQNLLKVLKRSKKQRDAVLQYFQLASNKKPIKSKDLEQKAQVSAAVLKVLVEKKVFEFYYLQTDRINFQGNIHQLKALNEHQKEAYNQIKTAFKTNMVTLLHGITGSGKTEIYAKLIQEVLLVGKQVLFLLPEIALTTQIIKRLQYYFGNSISVFHSKYSINERVEVWNNVLESKPKAQVVLGVRSSLFLPFSNLGLVIVDEEHENSYKQFDPVPRYNARDTAIVLAQQQGAKLLLGSATPSIESFFNAEKGKYGYVSLNKRFRDIQLPKIELINLKESYRKKEMKGHFSKDLLQSIQQALNQKEQVILFQNRRGYSPVVECTYCGVSPQCPNCDVSLTYHKFRKELKCHYCHYQRAMLTCCQACGSTLLNTKGFGTEQIELELNELFPKYSIARMDSDTTQRKNSFQKIIHAFEAHEIDILVGTQMLSKGLDFNNVSLVGILKADAILNFPNFRAHERAYQLMTQVSGRAGRLKKQGRVIIQTYNPFHQILKQVAENQYTNMYKDQLVDRLKFQYPPYYKLIKITLKHKDYARVENGIRWLAKSLQNIFKQNILGPSAPSISRIRNQYIKNIIVKIPPKQSITKTKESVQKIKNSFESIADFRSIKFIVDVDSYS